LLLGGLSATDKSEAGDGGEDQGRSENALHELTSFAF
jgi:hypothetical protein